MSDKPDPKTIALVGRYFQLEEMEDADTCETEVYLNADHTVNVGPSDGPSYIKGTGTWSQNQESFKMVLKRLYPAGNEKRAETDMGEFEYETERSFTGENTYVGGKIAVSGIIHNLDEKLGDEEVGYFNMIDTTQEKDQ